MNLGNTFLFAFDIDGIVLDTTIEMWKVITTHLDLSWSINKWVDYDVGEIVGVPTNELRHVYEPVLYNNALPPIEWAVEALKNILRLG